MTKKRSGFDIFVSWLTPQSVLSDPGFILRRKVKQEQRRLINSIGQAEYDRLQSEVTQDDIDAVIKECNMKQPKGHPPANIPERTSFIEEMRTLAAAFWEDTIRKLLIIACNVVCFYLLFKAVVFLLSL